MRVKALIQILFISLLLSGCNTVVSKKPVSTGEIKVKTVRRPEFGIIVPGKWTDDGEFGTMKLYMVGDGRGFPVIEKGNPIQVGLSVDKYVNDTQSFDDFVTELSANITSDRRLEIIEKDIIKSIKLADGTEGSILVILMKKFPRRQRVQIKLVARKNATECWVVTGWIVGGEKSEIAKMGSPEMKRLLDYIKSFVFDVKSIDKKRFE